MMFHVKMEVAFLAERGAYSASAVAAPAGGNCEVAVALVKASEQLLAAVADGG